MSDLNEKPIEKFIAVHDEALKGALAEKNAEIERLKQRVFQLEAIIEFGSHSTLEQYSSLLRRAADALEGATMLIRTEGERKLIDELRKAAE